MITEKAMTTGYRKGYYYAVAFFNLSDTTANFFNNTHKLMTQHLVVHLRKETIIDMKIRTTDSRGCYFKNHIFRLLNLGIGYIIDTNIPDLMKYGCFHTE